MCHPMIKPQDIYFCTAYKYIDLKDPEQQIPAIRTHKNVYTRYYCFCRACRLMKLDCVDRQCSNFYS